MGLSLPDFAKSTKDEHDGFKAHVHEHCCLNKLNHRGCVINPLECNKSHRKACQLNWGFEFHHETGDVIERQFHQVYLLPSQVNYVNQEDSKRLKMRNYCCRAVADKMIQTKKDTNKIRKVHEQFITEKLDDLT